LPLTVLRTRYAPARRKRLIEGVDNEHASIILRSHNTTKPLMQHQEWITLDLCGLIVVILAAAVS
jgi:hypothetical protein